eukprot:3424886-Pyramimonas_sp.AAC.1
MCGSVVKAGQQPAADGRVEVAASEALYRLRGCWETVIRALRNAAKCEQAKMMGAQSGCSGGGNDGAAGSLGEGIRRTTLTARNPSLHL